MTVRNTLLIGRHGADKEMHGRDGTTFCIVETRNVQFPAEPEGVDKVFAQLIDDALVLEEPGKFPALLFQAVPGQLAAALARWAHIAGDSRFPKRGVLIGVVVSVPGERPETQTRKFNIDPAVAREMLAFASPNAKVSQNADGVTVSLEPPMRFQFHSVQFCFVA